MVGDIDVGQAREYRRVFPKCLSRLEIEFQRLQGTHGGHGLGHLGAMSPLDGCTVGGSGFPSGFIRQPLKVGDSQNAWALESRHPIHGAIWDHRATLVDDNLRSSLWSSASNIPICTSCKSCLEAQFNTDFKRPESTNVTALYWHIWITGATQGSGSHLSLNRSNVVSLK